MIDEKHFNPPEAIEQPEEALTSQYSNDIEHAEPRLSESSEKSPSTFNESTTVENGRPELHRVLTHVSTHDAAVTNVHDEHYEVGDEIYNRFSHLHKVSMVTVLSFCSFLAPMSSTTILAASPEVVATYDTTGGIFGVSNALYMIFMGLSALVYGPLGTTYGKLLLIYALSVSQTIGAQADLRPFVPQAGDGHYS